MLQTHVYKYNGVKTNKFSTLLVASAISFNAFSGTVTKQSVCPAITEEASQIIAKVNTLSSQISKDEECRGISEKLATVNEVIGNEKWIEVRNLF